MSLTFLVGGARSGKSSRAVRLAEEWGGPVVFVATGTETDEEMAERIALHRAERPAGWTTVEEPLALADAVARAPADGFVVVDCLTIWVANALDAGWDAAAVERAAMLLADTAAGREAPVVVVSNEVGMGVVPSSDLARRYRDLLGRVNALVAGRADRAALVVAGRELELS
jgi:adenosyl cobinamide kinase/adenosyl cobinamide phosphate guanylyltransferase